MATASEAEGLKSILRTRATTDAERTSAERYSSSVMNRLQDFNPNESTGKFRQRQNIKQIIVFVLCVVGLVVLFLVIILPHPSSHWQSHPCTSDSCDRYVQRLRESRNTSIDLCRDFYQYVCGLWRPQRPLAQNVLQDSREGLKDTIVKNALKMNIPNRSQKPQNKAARFFKSCVIKSTGNDATAFKTFLKGLQLPWPQTIAGTDILEVLIELTMRWNFPVLFNIVVRTTHIRTLVFESSFLDVDPRIADPWATLRKVEVINSPYEDLIAKLVAALGEPVDSGFPKRMEQIQRKVRRLLKNATWEKSRRGEEYDGIRKFAGVHMRKVKPEVWLELVNKHLNSKLAITQFDRVFVDRIGFMRGVGALFDAVSNEELHLYAGFIVVQCLGRFVSSYIGALVYGDDQERRQEEDCFALTEGFMTYAWTFPEVDKLLEGERQKKAKEVASNVRQSLSDVLNNAPWMDNVTRDEALLKLQTAYISWKPAPADAWITAYTELPPMGNSFLQNLASISQDVRARVSENADWYRPLGSDVGPAYRPQHRVQIPPAWLSRELFPDAAYESIYYGGLGSVIARQMVAAYDLRGRNVDSRGIVRDWWTARSKRLHDNITQCIANYLLNKSGSSALNLDSISAAFVNAGQLKPLLGALRRSPGFPDWNIGFEQYTAEQLFFLAFCYSTCGQEDSPCNGVLTLFAPFATAFSCPSGSPMNPAERCWLW